jgi:hypothetical protein
MLKMNADSRPSCAHLVSKIEKILKLSPNSRTKTDESTNDLSILDTIQLPPDFRLLKEVLPEPKYDNLQKEVSQIRHMSRIHFRSNKSHQNLSQGELIISREDTENDPAPALSSRLPCIQLQNKVKEKAKRSRKFLHEFSRPTIQPSMIADNQVSIIRHTETEESVHIPELPRSYPRKQIAMIIKKQKKNENESKMVLRAEPSIISKMSSDRASRHHREREVSNEKEDSLQRKKIDQMQPSHEPLKVFFRPLILPYNHHRLQSEGNRVDSARIRHIVQDRDESDHSLPSIRHERSIADLRPKVKAKDRAVKPKRDVSEISHILQELDKNPTLPAEVLSSRARHLPSLRLLVDNQKSIKEFSPQRLKRLNQRITSLAEDQAPLSDKREGLLRMLNRHSVHSKSKCKLPSPLRQHGDHPQG